jgi:predicted alpha/beta-hydrolase family hydrolase
VHVHVHAHNWIAATATNPPSPPKGVVFLLAGAGAVPGGSTLLLQLAAFLRRSGYFVVAALTRPFDFEGRRRLEEADALIEALSDVAQLTVGRKLLGVGASMLIFALVHGCLVSLS